MYFDVVCSCECCIEIDFEESEELGVVAMAGDELDDELEICMLGLLREDIVIDEDVVDEVNLANIDVDEIGYDFGVVFVE